MTDFARIIIPATWAVFGATILFFAAGSFMLQYHWKKYGVDPKSLAMVRRIYFGVSGALVVLLLAFAVLIK